MGKTPSELAKRLAAALRNCLAAAHTENPEGLPFQSRMAADVAEPLLMDFDHAPQHEVMEVLVGSIGHCTQEEADILCTPHGTVGNLTLVASYEEGFILNLFDPGDTVEHNHLSDGLQGAIMYAKRHGFSYLRLDRDAQPLDGVVMYEW